MVHIFVLVWNCYFLKFVFYLLTFIEAIFPLSVIKQIFTGTYFYHIMQIVLFCAPSIS